MVAMAGDTESSPELLRASAGSRGVVHEHWSLRETGELVCGGHRDVDSASGEEVNGGLQACRQASGVDAMQGGCQSRWEMVWAGTCRICQVGTSHTGHKPPIF